MVDQGMQQLAVSSSPHLRSPLTVTGAMRDVLIALSLVTLVSVYWFKWHAVFLIVVCLVTAALTELLFRKAMKKPVTLNNGSAILTGLLVALCFGPSTPWWTAALATFIGIGLAKELMGGIGWNRFNPALFGRVSAVILAPLLFNHLNIALGSLQPNLGPLDVITQATPLAMLSQGTAMPALGAFFTAFPGGALAETSALALIIGGAYLIYKKHISWHIPVCIIGTVFVLALVFGGGGLNAFYHIFAGGVLLGAFFMATDWVTSPITPKGQVVFGIAIGVLIMVFRLFLPPTEGTAFSILIMNAFVPLIDRLTKRLKFGEVAALHKDTVPAKPAVEKSS